MLSKQKSDVALIEAVGALGVSKSKVLVATHPLASVIRTKKVSAGTPVIVGPFTFGFNH